MQLYTSLHLNHKNEWLLSKTVAKSSMCVVVYTLTINQFLRWSTYGLYDLRIEYDDIKCKVPGGYTNIALSIAILVLYFITLNTINTKQQCKIKEAIKRNFEISLYLFSFSASSNYFFIISHIFQKFLNIILIENIILFSAIITWDYYAKFDHRFRQYS